MSNFAVIADRAWSGSIFEVSVKQEIDGVGSLVRYQIDARDRHGLATLTAKVLEKTVAEPDIKANFAALAPGTVLDLTPPVKDVDPPVDEARNAFMRDLALMRRTTRIAADGLVVKDAEALEAIRSRVQAAIDTTPAYGELL